MVIEELDRAADLLRGVVGDLRPELLCGSDAARVLERFAAIEKLASSGKVLAASRVEASRAWEGGGHRSVAHWMAERSGDSVGHALGVLEAARSLEGCPGTEAALRRGELSVAQAREIAGAASADPSAEGSLLEAAKQESFGELRSRCRKVRFGAGDQTSSYEQIRRRRSLRKWTDPDGTFRLDARLTPDAGALLWARIEDETNTLFDLARKAGERESVDAYQADALVALVTGEARSAPKATVAVRVDRDALVRGHVEAGEVCEIRGVGPVPVEVARSLMNDAFVTAIVTNGTDVTTVSHLGRTINARLRTALEERDPLCVVPGCDISRRLEIDHVVGIAEGGPTELSNLARLCHFHHRQKTLGEWNLTGPPGEWRWEPRRAAGARAGAESGRTARMQSAARPPGGAAPEGEASRLFGSGWSQGANSTVGGG